MELQELPTVCALNWSDDDQIMLDLLLMENVSTSALANNNNIIHKSQQQNISKAQISAQERRIKHREVVRRAYHRNKAAMMKLREEVKTLENQLQKLSLSKQQQYSKDKVILPNLSSDHADETRQKTLELSSQLEMLQQESKHLQNTLAAHQRLLQTVCDSASEDEGDNGNNEIVTTPTKIIASDDYAFGLEGTSEEDFSPEKPEKDKFYAKPRSTYITSVARLPPLAMNMRRDIGYNSMTLSVAKTLVNETYQAILNFSLSGETVSTGVPFMGWEDKRLIDGTSVKFSLRKAFPHAHAMDFMINTWMCFSDPECSDSKFRGLMKLRILQRVNDDTIVAMRDANNLSEAKIYRTVYLLFRVRTRKGFIICVRSVDPLKVTTKALETHTRDGREIQWVDIFGWFVFDQLGYIDHDNCFQKTGSTVEYGGCMDYGERDHLAVLAMDTLSLVLRWESFMVSPLFALPPSS